MNNIIIDVQIGIMQTNLPSVMTVDGREIKRNPQSVPMALVTINTPNDTYTAYCNELELFTYSVKFKAAADAISEMCAKMARDNQ